MVDVADDEVDNQDQDHTLDPHMDKAAMSMRGYRGCCYGSGKLL